MCNIKTVLLKLLWCEPPKNPKKYANPYHEAAPGTPKCNYTEGLRLASLSFWPQPETVEQITEYYDGHTRIADSSEWLVKTSPLVSIRKTLKVIPKNCATSSSCYETWT